MTSQYGSIALMEATHKARKAELKHYHSIMLSHLQANHTQQVLEMKSQHSYYEGQLGLELANEKLAAKMANRTEANANQTRTQQKTPSSNTRAEEANKRTTTRRKTKSIREKRTYNSRTLRRRNTKQGSNNFQPIVKNEPIEYD